LDRNSVFKTEKQAHDLAILELKQSIANEKIEVDHFKTLLENEKAKVKEYNFVLTDQYALVTTRFHFHYLIFPIPIFPLLILSLKH
jgi:septum formation inhibitor-activating ATPase MinD